MTPTEPLMMAPTQHRSLAYAFVALVLLPSLGNAAVRVVGTAVELEPPPGFETQDRYPGFTHPESGSSILVTEIPGPYSGVTGGFTAEGLATRGMRLLSREELPQAAHRGLLVALEHPADGVVWRKWIRAFGDEDGTTVVVATYPAAEAAQLADVLRRAVLSARPTKAPADRDEGLMFSVDESAELVVIHRAGNLLMLAPPGTQIPVGNDVPKLIVGSSIAPTVGASLAHFARDRARHIEGVAGLEIVSQEALSVDDYPADEITAKGTDPDSGEALGVYQLVLDEGGDYHIAIGLVALGQLEAHLPAFRRVARSLRLR